jgi:hypothetical protein
VSEIFISYRRIDSEAAGGHLYSDLCDGFGKGTVFMDRRKGGIPWGADFGKSLNEALNRCQVLIALIGQQWASCERSPGVRRLDAPDDWVRCEIATALRQEKPVLPILLQGTPPPREDQLPAELSDLGFHRLQAYPVSEFNWEADMQRLFAALAMIPRLKVLHNLATSETGIRFLERLIRDNPIAADAVSRSRAVIETTDREIEEVRLLKVIHDALHEIESKCLIPIRAPDRQLSVDGCRRKFVQQDRAIRAALGALTVVVPELPVLLAVDLPGHLSAAGEVFEAATASPTPNDHDLVVARLEELVGHIPVRLNDAIDDAATRLQLRQLLDLMATIGDLLRPQAGEDNELRPLLEGITALDELRRELALRVSEHGLLQSLDNFLRETVGGQRRAGTSGRIAPATLAADWNHVRRLRARFKGPFTEEVEAGHHILE